MKFQPSQPAFQPRSIQYPTHSHTVASKAKQSLPDSNPLRSTSHPLRSNSDELQPHSYPFRSPSFSLQSKHPPHQFHAPPHQTNSFTHQSNSKTLRPLSCCFSCHPELVSGSTRDTTVFVFNLELKT